MLLTDYLYRTARDADQRIYYLQRFLDQACELFKSARESLVEDSLYAMQSGKARSASDVEALEQAIGQRYSLWYGPGSERTMEWVNAVHYFTRPLYRINYVYSKLLALTYFDRCTADSTRFVASYSAMLSNGYDAPPNELLKRFVGIRLDDPALVANAVRIIDGRTTELRRLYAVSVSRPKS